jgi:hypothetical protein
VLTARSVVQHWKIFLCNERPDTRARVFVVARRAARFIPMRPSDRQASRLSPPETKTHSQETGVRDHTAQAASDIEQRARGLPTSAQVAAGGLM